MNDDRLPMRGDVVITSGVQGWGNRKAGCDTYGPLGRWARPDEMPQRTFENARHGDLLADHLEELGVHEGNTLIVLASTSPFDRDAMAELRTAVGVFVASWVERRRDQPMTPTTHMELVAGWWLCPVCKYSAMADPLRPAPACPECEDTRQDESHQEGVQVEVELTAARHLRDLLNMATARGFL